MCKKLIKGENDFASCNPDLLNKFDYEKNEKQPDEIYAHGTEHVYMICENGHSYSATANNLSYHRSGCPICAKERKTSFPEQAVFFYVKKHFKDAINGDKKTIGMELDIYIPSIKTAIEYDGVIWHKNDKNIVNEKRKNELCSQNEIRLIRIREKGLPLYEDCICFERENNANNSDLEKVLKRVFDYLGVKDCLIDIDTDTSAILQSYALIKKEKSFAFKFPEMAKEMLPELNNGLTPDKVYAHSGVSIVCQCSVDPTHIYQSTPAIRAQGVGCPFCLNERKNPAIVCIETGEIFESSLEAVKRLKIESQYGKKIIMDCVYGRRKTAYGFRWRLAIDEEKEKIKLAKKRREKRILFDSTRADAMNRMLIDKMSQAMMPGEGMEASAMA